MIILKFLQYDCVCDPGYKGDFCDEIDFCLNGGILIEPNETFCECPKDFSGAACEFPNCRGRQKMPLRPTKGADGIYYCQCPEMRTGRFCEILTECENGGNLTENGGNLIENTGNLAENDGNLTENTGNSTGNQKCECPVPFTGETCESINENFLCPKGIAFTNSDENSVCVCNVTLANGNAENFGDDFFSATNYRCVKARKTKTFVSTNGNQTTIGFTWDQAPSDIRPVRIVCEIKDENTIVKIFI